MSANDSTIAVNSRDTRARKSRPRTTFASVAMIGLCRASLTRVRIAKPQPTCACPDHQLRRVKCKHIRAVEISPKREERPDGSVVVTQTKCTTYTQHWSAYNKAQMHETERLADLFYGLRRSIVQPPQAKGRPRLLLSDMVFSATFKVYSTVSGQPRRFPEALPQTIQRRDSLQQDRGQVRRRGACQDRDGPNQ